MVRNMIDIGLVRQHKNSGSLALTKKGHQCLTVSNVPCPDYCALSYRGDLLQRRLRIANITIMAYRAQLNLPHPAGPGRTEGGIPAAALGRARLGRHLSGKAPGYSR